MYRKENTDMGMITYALSADSRAYELGKGAWPSLTDDADHLTVSDPVALTAAILPLMDGWDVPDPETYAASIAHDISRLGPVVTLWNDVTSPGDYPEDAGYTIVGSRYREAPKE